MQTTWPDARGYFGEFGGRYVPETLMSALEELTQAYERLGRDEAFQRRFAELLRDYVGRPTPVQYARRLTERAGGAQICLKREDLAHTGAHKINNALGQVLLAQQMGKRRIIAETGAGQHGVATATVAALLDMECEIFMGSEDTRRQALNVVRMKLLGAKVRPVESGTRTLKDAMNEAMRDWITNVRTTFYVIGSVAGPHPYPMMVRDFQSVIGEETKRQLAEKEGRRPDLLVACVGGGSNAMGLFHPFLDDEGVEMVGVEAAGLGLESGNHSASICRGAPGVLHGSRTYILQDEDGQVLGAHSVAPGLDYPGVGPEHSYLNDAGRVHYTSVTDEEALEAFRFLSETEGIIPALESAHAVAYAMKRIPSMSADSVAVICISGRGDKDIATVARLVEGVEP